MTIHQRLVELGWTPLEGQALEKASEVFGYDLGPDAYAQKFGRKTVFLRYTGSYKLSVAMDRSDPERDRAHQGAKVSIRWHDLETLNDAARKLVAEFVALSQAQDQGDLQR